MSNRRNHGSCFGRLAGVLLFLMGCAGVVRGVDTNGLVLYLPFNGDVADASPFAHVGTNYGVIPAEDRFGNADSAGWFDGVDDHIRVGGSPEFAVTNCTVLAWVKPVTYFNSMNDDDIILSTFDIDVTRGGVQMALGTNDLCFEYWAWPGAEILSRGSFTTTDNNLWHFLAATHERQGTNGITKLYIDGQLVRTESRTNAPASYSNQVLYVGINCHSPAAGLGQSYVREFDGAMDEVMLYNRAFSQAEIQALYAPSNLVGFWPFDGSVADQSGYGHAGTNYGTVLTEDRFGNSNSACWFDGVDDHIRVGGHPAFGLTNCTVMAWIKPVSFFNSMNADDIILSTFAIPVESGGIQFHLGTNDLAFEYRPGPAQSHEVLSLGTFTTDDNNQWRHVAATHERQGTNGVTKLYVDGELVRSITQTNAAPIYSNQVLYLGINIDSAAAGFGRSYTREFHGAMDDVRLYGVALDQAAIQSFSTSSVPPPELAAPGGVCASDGSFTDRIDVAWSAVPDALGYEVWRGSTANSAGATFVSGVATTEYSDSSAGMGIEYFYWIKATNGTAVSAWSTTDKGWRSAETNGLVLYLPFDSSTADQSVYSHVGTNYGVVLTEDRHGASSMAGWFDGVDDHIRLGGSPALGVTNCTIMAWVKPVQYINAHGSEDVVLSSLSIGIPAGGVQLHLGTNILGFEFRADGQLRQLHSPILFDAGNNGEWHFLAVTHAREGTNGHTKFFLDGTLRATITVTNSAPVYSNQTLYVGICYDSPAAGFGRSYDREFNGAMDDLRMFRVALADDSIWSYYTSGLPAVATPTGVSASDGAFTDKIRVSWSPAAGASGYQVWRGTTPNVGSASVLADVAETLYDDTTAGVGTDYYYWIKATNDAFASSMSASDKGWRSAETDGLVLSLPFDGSLADQSVYSHISTNYGVALTNDRYGAASKACWFDGVDDHIRFGGHPALGVTNCTIMAWVRPVRYVNPKNCQDVVLSSFSLDLPAGGVQMHLGTNDMSFEYRSPGLSPEVKSPGVFGTNDDGQWHFLVATHERQGANGVTKLYVDGELKRSLSQSYPPPTYSNRTLYVGINHDCPAAGFGRTYVREFHGAMDEVRMFRTALNAAAISNYYTSSIPPAAAAPTSVAASDGVFPDKVRITWNTASGATAYQVWRGVAADPMAANLIGTANACLYDDQATSSGVVYWYWVRSVNAGGVSTWSDSDTGYRMAGPPAPTGVSASDGAYTDRVAVAWSAVAGAAGYQVWRGTSSSTSSASFRAAAASTSYQDVTAEAGRVYWYWVRATNSAGASVFSAPDTGWRAAYYTIQAQAGEHGALVPSGTITVPYGADKSFSITPDFGYHIADVVVDGASVGPVARHTFANVQAHHTISASFAGNQPPTIALAAAPESGSSPLSVMFDFSGSLDPDGAIVECALDKTGDGVFESAVQGVGALVVAYTEPGIFNAIGRVTDDAGATAVTSVLITVRGLAPVAALAIEPASGEAPLEALLIGTNSVAPAGRSLVAYEWDVNSDGVVDRVSVTGQVGWIFRDVGRHQVTLRVTDNQGLQASATADVEVRAPGLPPPAVTLTAVPASGVKPLTVVLEAQALGGGAIAGYSWDFDGNGVDELRTAGNKVTNRYDGVGVFLPRVTALAVSGLTGSGTATVSVAESAGLKTWIAQPKTGNKVWGTAVTLKGHAAPGSRVGSVQFQVKPALSNVWVNLGGALTPQPNFYSVTWDVTGLANGADYDLRTVAADTEGDSVVSESVRVRVDSGATGGTGGTEEGEVDGKHRKSGLFSKDAQAAMSVYEGTSVTVPMDALPADYLLIVDVIGANARPVNGAARGMRSADQNRRVSIPDSSALAKTVALDVPYPDADQDGIVDGLGISESELLGLFFDESAGQWKRCLSSTVHASDNFVRVKLCELGEVGLFGGVGLPVIGDYDGDRKSDAAVYDSNTGLWYIRGLDGTLIAWAIPWGWPGANTVPGDYNGDLISDLAVYDSNTGFWYIISLDGTVLAWSLPWGWPGANTVPGDYDGDRKSDLAVYDSNTGHWFVLSAMGDLIAWDIPWGWPGAVTVPGDYDGDLRSDLAVYDRGTGQWFVRSLNETVIVWARAWGWPGAITVPGDYDGDLTSDLAVYDDLSGQWFVSAVDTRVLIWATPWGWPGAVPVPGDYKGGGTSDLAVFDSNTGYWYIMTTDQQLLAWMFPWGWPGANPPGARR